MREETVDEASLQRLVPFRFNRRGPALAVGKLAGGERESIVIGGTTLDLPAIARRIGGASFESLPLREFPPIRSIMGRSWFSMRMATATTMFSSPWGAIHSPPGCRSTSPVSTLAMARAACDLPAGTPCRHCRSMRGRSRPRTSIGTDCLDVFIGGRISSGQYPFAPQSALLKNHGGKFEDVTDTVAPGLREVGMVTSASGAMWTGTGGRTCC
jgi:hypothetical protein